MSNDDQEKGLVATSTKLKRRFWLSLVTILFVSIGLIYAAYWYLFSQFYEITDDAYVAGNTIQIMPQIAGHVTHILADETGLVEKGTPILHLDKTDAIIALQNAEARLATTIRQTRQLFNNVNQLKANVTMQQANLEKLRGDMERRRVLAAEKIISAEAFIHLQSDIKAAESALEAARQQLAAGVALVSNTDVYHHPAVQQATVELRQAYFNLQRTTIYAPETGYVAKRNVQVGQQVTPNSILMVIVPIQQIWVNANYKETQLANIRINQRATIIADAYGHNVTYHGQVIGLSPGTGSSFDILPPQNATGNWIKIVQRLSVRIKIDPKELKTSPLRIGLSVKISIDTHNRQGRVLSQVPEKAVIYETKNFNDQLSHANRIIDEVFKANSNNNDDFSESNIEGQRVTDKRI